MAQIDGDRNLLFGLLALQLNFIDRDVLLDAFSRWVHDRAVPLDAVLRDRGALKPDEYDLLQALVAKYMERFGGDPQKSLQHVSSIGSLRDELSRIADADLHASLAIVSAARNDEDPYRTIGTASSVESSSGGTRFRILRPHATGGLGQVSVALDRELDRPVALKEIQDRHADEPHSRARFVQEAEITGKLEHPGIIPVYGLGHDVSGRPFYAMRFIQGDSLKQAIEAFHSDPVLKKDPTKKASTLRELLRRFTDVCNAVAYAHSRGVLHRDLKPGNIMLGPYGETLVVDWGLAKAAGTTEPDQSAALGATPLLSGPIRLSDQSSSRCETVAGTTIGTPEYASPEQVTGAIDRLSPRSDVYGLGATLYSLLAGRAPVESRDLCEVLRRVERGEISPLRSLDPSVPKPLEAICRKAMATHPEDRYDSAAALAKDVTRWLDDEPVTAYRDPLFARAGRWMRRHRTLVTSLTALVLTALVGLTVGVVLIERERHKTETQRQIAVANASQALHNLRLAQHAADGLLAEVADVDLADIPQMEPVRKRLLEKATEGYREFLAQKGNDALVRWGNGRSLARLGDIQALLGENPAAESSYREAIAGLNVLVEGEPSDLEFRRDLARAHHGLGVLLKDANRFQQAEQLLRQAIASRDQVAQGPGANGDDLQALADSRYQLGALLARRGGNQSEDASAYAAALQVQQGLVERYGERPELRTRQARYRNNMAKLQADSGRVEEAEATFRATLELMEPLLQGPSALPGARWQYARAANNLGTILLTGRQDDAKRQMRKAHLILRTLGNEFPAVTAYREELASVEYNLGLLTHLQGDSDTALIFYKESATLLAELRNRVPGNPALRQKLALALVAQSDALANRSPDEAETALRKALDEESAVLAQFANVPEYQSNLGRGHCQLAGLLLRRSNPEGAADEAEAALKLHKSVLEMAPRTRSVERYVWNDLGVLADALVASRRFTDAKKTVEDFLAATPANEGGVLNAAALLVRCAGEAARTSEGKSLADTLLARAEKVLADAVRSNLIRSPGVLDRPEFVPLRGRKEFKKLSDALGQPPRVG
jgi:serine/threonine-protein kinase